MTIREFAKSVGHEVVGKLTKEYETKYKWDWRRGKEVEYKLPYWVDEGGNCYFNDNGYVCIVTEDGGVI